jgi:hypothetical protein
MGEIQYDQMFTWAASSTHFNILKKLKRVGRTLSRSWLPDVVTNRQARA